MRAKIKKSFFNILVIILCTIIIIYLIINPDKCIKSALYGAKLFVYNVFPTMFPFVILCNIMMDYGGVYIYSKLFGKVLCKILRLPYNCSIVLIASALCGYPIGAKYSCDLYEKKYISFNDAKRLLNIATNCSPLFIVGTIGSSLLHSTYYGYLLLFSSYFSCFVMSLILKKDKSTSSNLTSQNYNTNINISTSIGQSLKNSVENAISSCTLVGGFIVLFSVVISAIKNTAFFYAVNNYGILSSILLGMIEMTNGCGLVASTSIDIPIKLMLFSFLTSFGGLSVLAQVLSFTYKHDFPPISYSISKFLQGIIASITILILYKVCEIKIYTSSNILSLPSFPPNTSIYLLIAVFIIPFILYKTVKFIISF